jgi:crotonobetainyl-CoA:carnitine CoA-transferase CaiB-like acyl-CoA transferase
MAQDAWLYLSCDTADQWRQLCAAIGRDDLAGLWVGDVATMRSDAITEALATVLAQHPASYWIERLRQRGLKVAPMRNTQEISRDPEMQAQGLMLDLESPEYGPLKEIEPAFRMSWTPGTVQGPAPMLGQHTDEVLRELGYSEADINDLRAKLVIP